MLALTLRQGWRRGLVLAVIASAALATRQPPPPAPIPPPPPVGADFERYYVAPNISIEELGYFPPNVPLNQQQPPP